MIITSDELTDLTEQSKIATSNAPVVRYEVGIEQWVDEDLTVYPDRVVFTVFHVGGSKTSWRLS